MDYYTGFSLRRVYASWTHENRAGRVIFETRESLGRVRIVSPESQTHRFALEIHDLRHCWQETKPEVGWKIYVMRRLIFLLTDNYFFKLNVFHPKSIIILFKLINKYIYVKVTDVLKILRLFEKREYFHVLNITYISIETKK